MESNHQPEEVVGEAHPQMNSQPAKEKGQKKNAPNILEQFISGLEALSPGEEKIQACLQFMRQSLSAGDTPKFKNFWEIRRMCLAFFKEVLAGKRRAVLWKEYTDLSEEARRLKMVLDEQSAFAYEQIDLAVDGVLEQARNLETQKQELAFMEIPAFCKVLQENKEQCLNAQSWLTLLNLYASRVHALRKEVIRTEMRIRNKNKLFEKLSKTGDLIFPKRKELIAQLSQIFAQEVKEYVDQSFPNQLIKKVPLHALREQIKTLQQLAKDFTLNVSCFNSTRLDLSVCWDKLKELDKERKKEYAEQKEKDRESTRQIEEKLEAFSTLCASKPDYKEIAGAFDQTLSFIKTLALPMIDSKKFKDRLFEIRKPFYDEKKRQEDLKVQQAQDAEKEKKAYLEQVTATIQNLLDDSSFLAEELEEQLKQLKQQVQNQTVTNADKFILDSMLHQLEHLCMEKKKEALFSSKENVQNVDALSTLLAYFRNLRELTKKRIEGHRKLLGGSGFDFEKAMMYRDLIEAEKKCLDEQEMSMLQIQEKIEQLEG